MANEADDGGHYLLEIVGRNIGGHAHRDPVGAVDEEVRKARREHQRFLLGVVEVGDHIDGVFFDIGHATIEGGYSWPIEAKLVEPFLATVSVKDFVWNKGDRGWRAEWCPLGEGMVNAQFFRTLAKSNFKGPITQQFEYRMGERREMIVAMKKDLAVLQKWLAA